MPITSRAERQRLKDLALGGAILPDAMERIAEEALRAFTPKEVIADPQAELCEKHLWHFVREAWPLLEPGTPFVDSWHIGCLCEHLEALTSLEIRKLLVNMPRRRGKSILSSVCWFCWAWIKQPWTRWSYISYGSSLSERDSKKCRDLIISRWYQERWGDRFKVRNDQNAAVHFANQYQGYRMATSVGGKTIGWGGEYSIADDISNLQDAWSPTILRKHAEVWTQGVQQSVNDPAKARFLVIAQRLNEADLPGVLMAEDLGYETLILPEEYEVTRVFFTKEEAKASGVKDPIVRTVLQRERPIVEIPGPISADGTQAPPVKIMVRDPRTQDGELLSPERFPRAIVEEEKKSLGAFGVAGQKQQRPSPLKGTIFQKSFFRKFREEVRDREKVFVLLQPDAAEKIVPAKDCRLFQVIDTASEIGEKNDWTVCTTHLLTPQADLLTYDCWRYRIEVTHQFQAFKLLRAGPCAWNAETETFLRLGQWPRPVILQAIEKASSGIGLIQQGRAAGMPFKVLIADQNPLERVGPIASEYYAGKVYHKEGAAWVVDYEGELMGFPNATFDDRVMTAAYAGYLMQHDAILRAHLTHELLCSSAATDKAAAEIAGQRPVNEVYTLNVPGVGDLKVAFPPDRYDDRRW